MGNKNTDYGVNLDSKISEIHTNIALTTFIQEINQNNKSMTDRANKRIKEIEYSIYLVKKKIIRVNTACGIMAFIIDMIFMLININDSMNNYSINNHILSVFYPAMFLVTVLIITRNDKNLLKEIKEYELKNEKNNIQLLEMLIITISIYAFATALISIMIQAGQIYPFLRLFDSQYYSNIDYKFYYSINISYFIAIFLMIFLKKKSILGIKNG